MPAKLNFAKRSPPSYKVCNESQGGLSDIFEKALQPSPGCLEGVNLLRGVSREISGPFARGRSRPVNEHLISLKTTNIYVYMQVLPLDEIYIYG